MDDEQWDERYAEIMEAFKTKTGREQGAFYLVPLDADGYVVSDPAFEQELRMRLDGNVSDPAATKLVIL